VVTKPIVLLLTTALLAGCVDQDPLGLSSRGITNGYELERFEGTLYYLVDETGLENGSGVLDGSVERLGWNDRYIVAWRRADSGGDPNGWMVVDAQERNVSGPISDAELAARPELRGIRPVLAHEAWARLPTWEAFVRSPAVGFAVFGLAVLALIRLRRGRIPAQQYVSADGGRT
jgi:hypothetical protein